MEDKISVSVCTKLLMSLKCAGISEDRAAMFLYHNVNEMVKCPPNYGTHKSNGYIKWRLSKCWIMRGFFPGTPIMFKIVIIPENDTYAHQHGPTGDRFYATISEPIIRLPSKKPWKVYLDSKIIRQINEKEAMAQLLDDANVNPILLLQHKRPKCISPKGCILYNLDLLGD